MRVGPCDTYRQEDAMTNHIITTFLVGALFVASGCTNSEPLSPLSNDGPLFQQVPADGNGNMIVTPVDFFLPGWATCPGGETLDLRIVGWLKDRPGEPAPTHGLLTIQYDLIYSNAAGETYVFRQAGTGLFYFDDNGDLIVAFDGRFIDTSGRLVINLSTGEVLSRPGRQVLADDLACAALT